MLASMAGELTAAEILERARWVYANCRTYQDRGEVVGRIAPMEEGGHAHTTRTPFSTAFVRPDRFRFEWADAEVGPEDEWHRALVLWNADGVRSSWSLGSEVQTHGSVHEPIGANAGVSHGASHIVPTLLMPGVKAWGPLAADGYIVRGRARIGSRECFELQATHDRGSSTLWIDCEDFLLRRVDETHDFDRAEIEELRRSARIELERDASPFRSESTTTYEPIVDASIDPERFSEPAEWPRAGRRPDSRPASIVVGPVPTGSPSAPEILARVRAVYTGCRSIRDHGSETTVTVRDSGERSTDVSSFSLEFVRPDRFRLDTVDHEVGPESEWLRTVHLLNEDGARSRFAVGPFLRPWIPAELFAMLALQHVVPGLFVPCRLDRDPIPTPDSARIAGMSMLAERECFLLDGTVAQGFQRRLWIDRELYLVRRCDDVFVFDEAWYAKMRAESEDRLRKLPPGEDPSAVRFALELFSKRLEPYRTETTRFFEPELNAAIPAERFATPEAWRRLPISDLPAPGAPPDPPSP
jgi:hypothetical protein